VNCPSSLLHGRFPPNIAFSCVSAQACALCPAASSDNKYHGWYTLKNTYLWKSFYEEISFDSSSFIFTSSFVEKCCKDGVFERKWHFTYIAWRDHPFELMFFLHMQSIFIELIPYRIGFVTGSFPFSLWSLQIH
jgi:hypothetical protein